MSVDFIVGILLSGLAVAAAFLLMVVTDLSRRVGALDSALAGVAQDAAYCRKIVDMSADMHDVARDQILRDVHKR